MLDIQSPTIPFPPVSHLDFELPAMPPRIPRLTPRELQILRKLAQSMPTKEIAVSLGISISTINGYVHDIYNRLGISNRMELGAWIALNAPALIPVA